MKTTIYAVVLLLAIASETQAQNWLTTGNAGTTTGNFVGTTDASALRFRIYNQPSGIIDSSLRTTALGYQSLLTNSGASNSAFGFRALYSNTTGYSNTAIGVAALYQNTTRSNLVAIGDSALYNNGVGVVTTDQANNNTAIGSKALYSNTKGFNNTAIGSKALYSNSTGINNTANGANALYSNSTGFFNTANGRTALYSNTSGYQNTAIGESALYSNTTGYNNTAIGYLALPNSTGYQNTASGYNTLASNNTGYNNTANGQSALFSNFGGFNNTANGSNALYFNTSGNHNTANGSEALFSNTTGYSNVAIGAAALRQNTTRSNLVAIGDSALYNNGAGATTTTQATNNTAVGSKALYSATTGAGNTASGFQALYSTTTGVGNTANGTNALRLNTTGSNNTALGNAADVTANNLTNATAIGYNAKVNASNKMQLGASTTTLATSGGITIVSDGRFKDNVSSKDVAGLDFINDLRPVAYNFNYKKYDDFLNKETGKNKTDNPDDNEYQVLLKQKGEIREVGFIAQEVNSLVKEKSYSFNGVYTPQNDNDNYALDYSRFVVPLVKAVQELSVKNEELKKENAATKADLQKQIDDLKALMTKTNQSTNQQTLETNHQQVSLGSSFSLEQNLPNPFKGTTTINCFLPENKGNAFINFYSQSGILLKSVKITGEGKNTITLNAKELSAGIYSYSLVADGKVVDTKQMILQR